MVVLTLGLTQIGCSDNGTNPSATGSLEASVSTAGDGLDPDGYTVSVDGGAGRSIAINDTIAFADLVAGDHSVELSGVASNCDVSGSNPRTLSVPENDTVATAFEVSCTASGGGTSQAISGVAWACDTRITDSTGESDLWPVTWSDDGHQYTAWGDGYGFEGSSKVSYGIAQLQGAPDSYTGTDRFESAFQGNAGKVAGIISLGGDLYMWINEQDGSGKRNLYRSTDKGQTKPASVGVTFPQDGVGPETFIQMGQDHGAAPDNYVYAPISEYDVDGAPLNLMRAPVSGLETQGNWEVFSGTPSNPSWSTDFSQRSQIHRESGSTAPTHMVTITYIPSVAQYVMIWPMDGGSYAAWKMLVSDNPYGPWTEIATYTDWCGDRGESNGPLHYHIAPKWIGSVSGGQLDFWLVWSGLGSAPADEFNIRQGTFSIQ